MGRASEGSSNPTEEKHWQLRITLLAEEVVKVVRFQIHFEGRVC